MIIKLTEPEVAKIIADYIRDFYTLSPKVKINVRSEYYSALDVSIDIEAKESS